MHGLPRPRLPAPKGAPKPMPPHRTPPRTHVRDAMPRGRQCRPRGRSPASLQCADWPGLPCAPQITPEEYQAARDELRAANARPLKKVVEAKARKQKRLRMRLQQVRAGRCPARSACPCGRPGTAQGVVQPCPSVSAHRCDGLSHPIYAALPSLCCCPAAPFSWGQSPASAAGGTMAVSPALSRRRPSAHRRGRRLRRWPTRRTCP